MVFFLVLYLETSFLVYTCILGQLRKNFFFGFFGFFLAAILEKRAKYIRARALTYVTRLIYFRLLSFSEWCIMTILSRMHFIDFWKK